MNNIIEAKSTFFGVFFRSLYSVTLGLITGVSNEIVELTGEKHSSKKSSSPINFWDLLTPWKIIVDIDNKRIITIKRNWYLIGNEESTYNFKSVRNVVIKNYIFSADIGIRVFAGSVIVYAISKKDAREIRDLLMNTDWVKNDTDISVDIH